MRSLLEWWFILYLECPLRQMRRTIYGIGRRWMLGARYAGDLRFGGADYGDDALAHYGGRGN